MVNRDEGLPTDWSEVERHVVVDERQKSYRISLSRGWAESFASSAAGSPYFSPAFDLLLDLRAACHVASVPHQLPHMLEMFASGWMQAKENSTYAEKALRAMTFKLAEELRREPVSFSIDQLEAIVSVCNRLTLHVAHLPSQSAADFQGQPWEGLFKDPGFRLATWGSQRSAYVSAYNAYDHFLVRCLRIKVKNPTVRLPRGRKSGQRLGDVFGDDVRNRCWDNREFRIARALRNSLCHEGGKETDELRDSIDPPHEISMTNKDKMLQVMPEDTKRLLRLIEDAAQYIVRSVTKTA